MKPAAPSSARRKPGFGGPIDGIPRRSHEPLTVSTASVSVSPIPLRPVRLSAGRQPVCRSASQPCQRHAAVRVELCCVLHPRRSRDRCAGTGTRRQTCSQRRTCGSGRQLQVHHGHRLGLRPVCGKRPTVRPAISLGCGPCSRSARLRGSAQSLGDSGLPRDPRAAWPSP